MRSWIGYLLVAASCAVNPVRAQSEETLPLEIAGTAGFAIARGLSVEKGTATGKTGFENGIVGGGLLGHDSYTHLGGEVRYFYRNGAALVDVGGSKATLASSQHSFTYDLVWNFREKGQPVRPFLSFGGGARFIRGTGVESSIQRGADFVTLTAATETLPVFAAGGGVKFRLNDRLVLRLEGRDMISAAPKKVLTPAPGASLGGVYHDIMVLVTVGYRF